MGTKVRAFAALPPVSLEELVPPDHFYRHLDRALALAEAKRWHGLRRFRLRGAEKVNVEAQLIAAGQNLKRLLSRRGWGRRPWPSGAAGVALPAARPAAWLR